MAGWSKTITSSTRRPIPPPAIVADNTWELEETTWRGGDALLVIPFREPFAVWPFRDADGVHVAWYGNLQRPLTRTERGFDTDDWVLDVVASPDLSSWRLKDEDELVEAERVGLHSADEVAAIRDAASRVVALIECRDQLFADWATWQPDANWPIPSFE